MVFSTSEVEMAKPSEWAKQTFVERHLEESDWANIMKCVVHPVSDQRKFLEALHENENRPLSNEWFKTNKVLSTVAQTLNDKFRDQKSPYKVNYKTTTIVCAVPKDNPVAA